MSRSYLIFLSIGYKNHVIVNNALAFKKHLTVPNDPAMGNQYPVFSTAAKSQPDIQSESFPIKKEYESANKAPLFFG
jgi:hypothetical protein